MLPTTPPIIAPGAAPIPKKPAPSAAPAEAPNEPKANELIQIIDCWVAAVLRFDALLIVFADW